MKTTVAIASYQVLGSGIKVETKVFDPTGYDQVPCKPVDAVVKYGDCTWDYDEKGDEITCTQKADCTEGSNGGMPCEAADQTPKRCSKHHCKATPGTAEVSWAINDKKECTGTVTCVGVEKGRFCEVDGKTYDKAVSSLGTDFSGKKCAKTDGVSTDLLDWAIDDKGDCTRTVTCVGAQNGGGCKFDDEYFCGSKKFKGPMHNCPKKDGFWSDWSSPTANTHGDCSSSREYTPAINGGDDSGAKDKSQLCFQDFKGFLCPRQLLLV